MISAYADRPAYSYFTVLLRSHFEAGKDITHLLEGLGKEHGLGKLFNRMQKLAWGMAMFKTLFDFILPALMSTLTWQKVQQWLVRIVTEYLPKGGKLVSAAGL